MDSHKFLKHIPLKRFQDPPPRVAVLRLSGVIGGMGPLRSGLTLSGVEKSIEQAFEIPRLSAVALAVNSPGGSPVQSALIAKRIRDFAAEKEVPVLAFCEDVAASGGYWLACAADEIFVNASSIVGSIGVISAGFGFQQAIEKLGIERRVHTSGDRKSMLDPFAPEDPEDVTRLKALQAEIHGDFKAMVSDRRGDRLKAGEDILFSGEFWTGTKAVDLGLADGEGELRATLRERFGEKVQIRPITAPKSWLKRRLGLSALVADEGSSGLAQGWAAGALAAAEERALWARFGL
ncbi:MAG: S49 family peptidase [Pseudomonadota bacterium]